MVKVTDTRAAAKEGRLEVRRRLRASWEAGGAGPSAMPGSVACGGSDGPAGTFGWWVRLGRAD